MSERAKVAEFVSFCVEMFAKAKRLSGDRVTAVFKSCGAFKARLISEGKPIPEEMEEIV